MIAQLIMKNLPNTITYIIRQVKKQLLGSMNTTKVNFAKKQKLSQA